MVGGLGAAVGVGAGAAGGGAGAAVAVTVGIGPFDASDGPMTATATIAASAAVLIRVMLPVRATAEPAVIVVRTGDHRTLGDDHEGGHLGVQDEGLVGGDHVTDEVDVANAGARA